MSTRAIRIQHGIAAYNALPNDASVEDRIGAAMDIAFEETEALRVEQQVAAGREIYRLMNKLDAIREEGKREAFAEAKAIAESTTLDTKHYGATAGWAARATAEQIVEAIGALSSAPPPATAQTICEHGWSSLHPQPCPECDSPRPYEAPPDIAQPRSEEGGGVRRFRHKKRGTTYRLIGEAQIQCASPLTEYEVVTVYRAEVGPLNDESGLWVRRKAEFEDGRFEEIEATTPSPKPEDALRDVADERKRQIEVERWTIEHDDGHSDGEMALAAACYAMAGRYYSTWTDDYVRRYWPWSKEWWRPTNKRRNLIKAAALIVAEIERLDRAALAKEVK
jgi:hypothetical protein